jgi:hypothetical protein
VLAGARADTAHATSPFCLFGFGAGQCNKPEGIAVDRETGRVYVADRGNRRVDVFTASGSFLMAFGWGVADGTTAALQTCGPEATPPTASCFKGLAGSGAGQMGAPTQIAVDNEAASPSHHDVYVGEAPRVQKFSPTGQFLLMLGKGVNSGTSGNANLCTNAGPPTDVCGAAGEGGGAGEFNQIIGIGVGPAGVLNVADMENSDCLTSRVQKFEPSGAFQSQVSPALPACASAVAFAVDGAGDFYISYAGTTSAIGKFEPNGTLLTTIASNFGARSLGTDPSNDLFAMQRQHRALVGDEVLVVTEYDSSGALLHRFGYGTLAFNLRGLAPFHTAEGEVFGTEEFTGSESVGDSGNRVVYLPLPPPGPIAPAVGLEASPVGTTRATLKAEINPEGKETTYHFEYVDETGFQEQGNSFTGPHTKSTPTGSTGSAGDFGLHGVTAQIGCMNPAVEIGEGKCLAPQTVYHYRIVATNSDGAGEGTTEGTFKTSEAPEFLATWATGVGPDSATLHAELNPHGLATTGYFEFLEEAKYQENLANSLPGFSGAARAPAADLDFGEGEAAVARSVPLPPLVPATVYRYRLAAANLLTSEPVHGPERTLTTFSTPQPLPCPGNEAFRYGPGALLPDCRAYEMVTPLDKGGADIAPGHEGTTAAQAALDQSSIGGSKLAYGTLHPLGDAESSPYISQYIAARNAVTGWSSHAINPPKTTLVLPVTWTIDTEFKAFSADLCEAWLRSVSEPVLAPGGVAGYPNVYRRSDQECGEQSFEAITTAEPPNVLVEKSFPLELQGISANGTAAIYVNDDNLPGTTPSPAAQPASCTSQGPHKGEGCQLRLYEQKRGGPLEFVCVLPNGIPVNGGCSAGSANETANGSSRLANVSHAISADGSHVFWSASETGIGPIYVRIGGTQTVAVSKAAEEASGTTSSRYWSAAEDGSAAIFTTGQKLYRFDVASEVSTLIAGDSAGVVGASADATKVYFVSPEALTGGEENSEHDKAVAGKPNLYLYELGVGTTFIATLASGDASPVGIATPYLVAAQPFRHNARTSADGEQLVFVSMASPTHYENRDAESGKLDTEVYLYDAGSKQLLCASCNPSSARPAGSFDAKRELWVAAQIPASENNLYASRVLTAGGKRLFFEANDALSAADTNGVTDIYQWEASGTGGCTEGSPSYSAQNEGCVDLLSSGRSPRKAEFVDASPSGEDVFFATEQSLVGQDTDELVDIYDARANGGFPAPEPVGPECEAEACQHPAPAPQFQTPSSSQYEGNEDLPEKSKRGRCRRGTHKQKKGGKVRCVKHHSKKGKKKSKSGRASQ